MWKNFKKNFAKLFCCHKAAKENDDECSLREKNLPWKSRDDEEYQRNDQLYSKMIYYASKQIYIKDRLFLLYLSYVALSAHVKLILPFIEYAVDD